MIKDKPKRYSTQIVKLNMQKPKKHIKVVAAIIFDDNGVYCFRRGQNKYEYLANKFEFPGGKIEPKENKKQALKREILEELNVDILVKDELIEIEHEYPDFTLTMSCFACEIKSGIMKLSEHTEVVLKAVDRIAELDWLPADMPAVKYLMENF
ncbi:(deoxy)nucleoside triphosphate pyrophosphohydrolase [Planktomarina sp.]|nr:(deoxy)nucleoside triphosphate pyrophosphohydrolase [Planktomarina sp.]